MQLQWRNISYIYPISFESSWNSCKSLTHTSQCWLRIYLSLFTNLFKKLHDGCRICMQACGWERERERILIRIYFPLPTPSWFMRALSKLGGRGTVSIFFLLWSTSVVERSDPMCNVFQLDPCSRSGYLRRECQVCGIEVSSGGRVGGRAWSEGEERRIHKVKLQETSATQF